MFIFPVILLEKVIFNFGDSYPEQPEYYTDWRHVFEVLEDGM